MPARALRLYERLWMGNALLTGRLQDRRTVPDEHPEDVAFVRRRQRVYNLTRLEPGRVPVCHGAISVFYFRRACAGCRKE